ncbi:MAG: hypothetical protein A3F68_07255 [Acidobacteria bacterium RIFCSPLOWO2_12_FULL_54_10]|nr:MAG: hypothetical protein A3F68_07255 [Acidobacteria bacterium RIFCSPLOWO2_12_FULL_54_10]
MARNDTKVLLVDDNPIILDLMRQGVEELAHVSTNTNSSEAFQHCLEEPPDLLICDYRMPGMDGGRLVQQLKQRPETQNVRVILVATKADIDEKLQPMTDMVEDFFIKPFFVKDLTAKAKRVIDKIYLEKMQQHAPAEGTIRGRLSEMNLIDLLQSLELGQKTCLLTLTQEGQSCQMFFADGQIHHAELGSVIGDEAVYGVAGWSDGSFEINFNSKSDKKTTTRSTQGLLMEALRLHDESTRDS